MAITLLRDRDRVASPWKNGGGITRDIAAWPPGAGLDDFDWRISLATVAAAGPFSEFPGVDRILTVVDGALAMTMNGAPPRTFDCHAPPLRFAGEAPVHGAVPNGQATDFNVMTRRERIGADVERRRGHGTIPLESANWIVVLACAAFDLTVGDEVVRLGRFDAVLADGARPQLTMNLPDGAHILVAKLRFL